MELKIGDTVRLKSGGPVMTIEDIGTPQYSDAPTAWCVWFEKTDVKKGSFPMAALDKYTPG